MGLQNIIKIFLSLLFILYSSKFVIETILYVEQDSKRNGSNTIR